MKNKIVLLALILSITLNAWFVYRSYLRWYAAKKQAKGELVTEGDIAFIGNSLIAWFDLTVFGNPKIKNVGVSGNRTDNVLSRVTPIASANPSKAFLLVGINDLNLWIPVDTVVANLKKITKVIQGKAPSCKIYIHSLFPTTGAYKKLMPSIMEYNMKVEEYCSEMGFTYIDMFSRLVSNGEMNPNYSIDGLHLNAEGYKIWADKLKHVL
jgi:lysophospholipase L1-like esterase